ncbi:MAG: hypothetical protein JSV81_16980 [Anaerolineales bacterium]|nr:MAG: hypothetical protein JSV81_16980 [Anaerolineales bacterium]
MRIVYISLNINVNTSCQGPQLPPIVSTRWRRVTPIVTSGDRFMGAHEINDVFEGESPAGQLYVRLKELGIAAYL